MAEDTEVSSRVIFDTCAGGFIAVWDQATDSYSVLTAKNGKLSCLHCVTPNCCHKDVFLSQKNSDGLSESALSILKQLGAEFRHISQINPAVSKCRIPFLHFHKIHDGAQEEIQLLLSSENLSLIPPANQTCICGSIARLEDPLSEDWISFKNIPVFMQSTVLKATSKSSIVFSFYYVKKGPTYLVDLVDPKLTIYPRGMDT